MIEKREEKKAANAQFELDLWLSLNNQKNEWREARAQNEQRKYPVLLHRVYCQKSQRESELNE